MICCACILCICVVMQHAVFSCCKINGFKLNHHVLFDTVQQARHFCLDRYTANGHGSVLTVFNNLFFKTGEVK